ncbi:MAG: hypothetical protein JO033_03225, partial [Acidobacteriaceae bacterium]|nr:hypothetical protein [Acidobacteriaceae bacterium]
LLHQAGISEIAVPPGKTEAWKNENGLKVDIVDLDKTIKLPAPGVDYHTNEASASRVPWVNSNGWRFMRQPNARFSYYVKGSGAALAAAEAFSFDSNAVIQTDEAGLAPLAVMLKFLSTLPPLEGPALADIGFVDHGSGLDAEVMNLLVRENLLFRIVRAPDSDLKLTVELGSKEYSSKNPDVLEHQIRANLGDDRRLIRIYGTSVVVAHVMGGSGRLRLHLLNYGSGRGTIVGAFRVRVLGSYDKAQLRSFGPPGVEVTEFSPGHEATEFAIPTLKAYAVVDLTQAQSASARR